jgi:hypothetical protein
MVKWEYRKKNDMYEGYVGRMKVFEIVEAPHQYRRIKGIGEWLLKFPKISFLKPCRFTTPSAAKLFAERVIDRIQKNFYPEELKKSFRKSGKKG